MRDSEGIRSASSNSTLAGSEAPKSPMLTSVRPSFDLSSVRCSVERQLNEKILADEDLRQRIELVAEEVKDGRVQGRLELMTDAYRVDEAITPKLYRLGTVLTRALRLVHPLDIFVKADKDLNAYCLPSRKGSRLVMCLFSELVASLSSQELLFVMGHEVGHAILRHARIPRIGFDNPNFSPLEVVRVRALERAHEISCDRFGLLACQDVRVASTALFKVASGLSERWISFDETAYSKHFDELSSMSEFVDIEDAARTHPFTPLRVKALVAFSRSELFADAFGKTNGTIPTEDMERAVETTLSVLDPDVSELEGKDTEEAANRFVIDGALKVVVADGEVASDEVAWLEKLLSKKLSGETIARDLSDPDFQRTINDRLESNAGILRNKLSEVGRAKLLPMLRDVAQIAGGILESEYNVLEQLRELLKVSENVATFILDGASKDSSEESAEQLEDQTETEVATESNGVDPFEAMLQVANLPYKALAAAKVMCDEIRSHSASLGVGARVLVSWAIGASRDGGPLSDAQGKKLAVAAIRVCRDVQTQKGVTYKARPNAADKLIKQFGIVALFSRNETVFVGADDRPYVVLSVSRARGSLVIAPADDLEATQEVDPHELRKDAVDGDWPAELTDA